MRRARPADLQAILTIENASFDADAWPLDEFEAYLQFCPEMFYVLETPDGAIAAYSITRLHRRHAELVSIATAPAYRGRGLGARLLKRSMNAARRAGAESMWLTVRPDNIGALRLYESLGFRRTRRVRDYYADGVDGLRLTFWYSS